MSVFPVPLDPIGINASGLVTLFWVPAIASPATAVTIPQLNAGINISNALYAWDEGGTQTTNERVKYGYLTARKSLGRPTYDIQPIEYDDDPQGTSAGGQYAYTTTLVEGASGFFVHRRGLPPTTAFAASQKVDIRQVVLGHQFRVPVAPGEEGQKFRIRQTVETGAVWNGIVVSAA